MGFQFASCDTSMAKRFLQTMYPSQVVTWDTIPKMYDLISRDIVRIQDPAMHNPPQIVHGNNYSPAEHDSEIAMAMSEFLENVHNRED